jgi:RimJ/RimL family protein N-acetyltransferase
MNLTIDNHIELIPINLDYSTEIHENFNDEIIEFLPIEKLSSNIQDTIEFIKRSIEQKDNGTDLVWVILNENEFAGCCGIHKIQSKTPHFGIWIKSQQQGKGIGKKVVHYVLNWGISNLEVEYIKYPVDKRNARSIKLIKGLNLKLSDHYQTGEKKILETDEYRIYKKTTANTVYN